MSAHNPPDAGQSPLPAQNDSTDPEPDTSDTDSALGSEYDSASTTASLSESITQYQHSHGRRYHAYQAGRYVLPNDEEEQERMDLQYHALRLAFDDKLFFAPVGGGAAPPIDAKSPTNGTTRTSTNAGPPTHPPSAILDVGTGTGIWAVDAGDAYPETEVLGTDLSPIQPAWVPGNVKFEVDDAEADWTFPANHFDLVHTRIMNGSLRSWPRFFEQAFKHLKPGGWVECQELSVDAKSDDGTLPEEGFVRQWCENQEKAFRSIGGSLVINGEVLKGWMEDAGFTGVEVREFKLPIGQWPKEGRQRECGAFQLVAMLEGIQGLTIAAWTRFLGWKEEEVEVFIARVRGEWKRRGVHSYWPL